ncbi:S49 family peptidase [Bernardetia sp. Wsw4-3y2]|uniref:S49 family peptidase n=1 Tax=Bernardetia sp. Wsw4-3y2 TaxID=3127471 RepID=UPI0030D06221
MNKQQLAYRNLFNALSNGAFAIEQTAARKYYPFVKSFLEGNHQAFQNFYDDDEDYNTSGAYEEESVTAVVHISGVIMKNDGWCSLGTQSIAKKIKALEADDKVNSIFLKIDSPGGMVDGTQALHETLKNCTKPTLAFVDDGLCASAAYEIAAGCDEIWASKNTDRVGSIGTMITIYNLEKMYENEGVKIHDIYATKSTDKNKMYKEASEGNYKKIVSKMLDPMNEEFINAIKSQRPNISEKALTGEIFMASEAIKIGLIDQIGSYEDAINHLSSKVKSLKSSSNQPQNNMNLWQKLFPNAKTEQEAQKQFEAEIQSSQMYTSLLAEKDKYKAESTAQQAKITQLETQVSTLTAQNEALAKENAGYSEIAGAAHTKPVQKEIERTPDLQTEPTSDDIMQNSPYTKYAQEKLGE